jgi:hypothetical protein
MLFNIIVQLIDEKNMANRSKIEIINQILEVVGCW